MASTNKPAIGMLSWLGIGNEVTYGTAVARTEFVEIESEGLMKDVQKIEAMSVLRRGTISNKIVAGAVSVGGDISFPAQYDGWLKFAKHAFGTVVDSQPDITNAPTAYNHQFTIADQLPTGLTIEIFRDSSQFTTEPNKSFLYAGCKVDKIEFSCAVDEILKINIGIMGRDEARAAYTSATPSFSNTNYAVFTQGTLKYNDNEMEVDKFSLSINNGLGARYKLGSGLSREPNPENKIVVNGSFECEFSQWNEYDDMVAATLRTLVVEFRGTSLGGAINQMIKLTCNNIIIDKANIVVDKPGRIKLNVEFKAYRNTAQTLNEVIMDVVNTVTTV